MSVKKQSVQSLTDFNMYLFKAERIVLRLSLLLEFLFFIKMEINYGLAECRSGIEIQLTLNYPPKSKKVYSIFSKIAGLGSAHKNLPI